MTSDRLRAVTERLKKIAAGGARLEAKMLIEAAGNDADSLESLVQRRLAGEPADRLAGRRGFWTLDLIVTPDVLSPRPDSETIVELACDLVLETHARHAALRILDLGTGSGALLLALLAEFPMATGLGIDISTPALEVARRNAARNGLAEQAAFAHGVWLEGLSERFDLILSNPPYISTGEIAGLEIEVREHDPALALDGGLDGLDAYRAILPVLSGFLAHGGIAVFEIGYGQESAVTRLADAVGLKVVSIKNDLSRIPRAIAMSC
ncbi:MAG: peptide chain release factor N(5)-glutamine methyltransferase [Beijerinckiaceae bacterium]